MRDATDDALTLDQARKDKRERVYHVHGEIYVQLAPDSDYRLLYRALDPIIREFPWVDIVYYESTLPGQEEPTFSAQGECRFIWNAQKQCLETTSDTLPMRRGQLVAFENWMKATMNHLARKQIPGLGIRALRAKVTTSREISL